MYPLASPSPSPQPGYLLSLSLSQDDRLIDDKLDIVETAGVGTSVSFALTPNTPPPEAMLQFLRLQQLKGERWGQQAGLGSGCSVRLCPDA